MTLLQIQDAGGNIEQIVLTDLEQLVSRIGLQNIDEGFAVVAVRGVSGAVDDIANTATQQRNATWRQVVSDGRKQAHEQALADDPPLGIVAADNNRIHVHGAMYGRPMAGLGNRKKALTAHQVRRIGTAAGCIFKHTQRRIAQHAETGVPDHGYLLLLAACGNFVFTETKEGVVIVVQPTQQLAALFGFFFRDAFRRCCKLVDDFFHTFAHRAPIFDGGTDILQRFGHRKRDLDQILCRLLHDLEMHEALGLRFRMRMSAFQEVGDRT